jgi:hypothetical protein
MVVLLVMGRRFPPLTQLRTRLAQIDTWTKKAPQRRMTSTSTIAAYLGLRWHEIAGLRRRYVEVPQGLGNVPESVSWACDAQECERSGGVAGVAAQRGGEVAVAP